MLGLKLNHVSKRGHRYSQDIWSLSTMSSVNTGALTLAVSVVIKTHMYVIYISILKRDILMVGQTYGVLDSRWHVYNKQATVTWCFNGICAKCTRVFWVKFWSILMVWWWTSDRSLPESMMAQFNELLVRNTPYWFPIYILCSSFGPPPPPPKKIKTYVT